MPPVRSKWGALQFGKPAHLLEDIPSHLERDKTAPRALINGSKDDYRWFGDDGKWDPQKVLDELTTPAALLRLVVQAIVAGNPSSARNSEDRIEDAMRALLGVKGKKGRRKLSSDTPILKRMADEFLQGFYGFKDPHPNLTALADWALREEPDFTERGEEWKENRRRTITRKFQQHQNRLLAQFSSAHDMEVQETLSRVRATLNALADLGIGIQAPNTVGQNCPN